MKSMMRSGLLVAGISVALSSGVQASSFGSASNYNIFVFGNDTQSGSDVTGRLAVGGTLNPGFAVGTNSYGGADIIDINSGIYSLVVGGNTTFSNNSINGSVFVGGNAAFSGSTLTKDLNVDGSLSITNMTQPTGNITYGTTYFQSGTGTQKATQGTTAAPFSFSSAQTSLQSYSTFLAARPNTTTAVNSFNTITITAQSGLNVVTLSASDLSNNVGIVINGPADATVLINVAGTSDSFSSSGSTLNNGITSKSVLYNFASAANLTDLNAGVNGSILAPYAAFAFTGGNVNGQIIANSISGGGEAHNFLFTGTLPNATLTATPEPSTWMSLAGGGMLLVGIARRRRTRKV